MVIPIGKEPIKNALIAGILTDGPYIAVKFVAPRAIIYANV